VIAHSSEEAAEALESLMEEKVFGSAGEKVVVEELLQGVEASVFSLCNGTDAVILGSAMDYKRAFDGDQGPNTGGMGSISPHPLLTREMQQGILETIIKPVCAGSWRKAFPTRECFMLASCLLKIDQRFWNSTFALETLKPKP